MRLPVEKSKFFRALRLDFSKERDKLLIEIAAQNELIQLKQEKKQSQNPMGTAAQLIPNSNIPNYLSKKTNLNKVGRCREIGSAMASSAEPEVR